MGGYGQDQDKYYLSFLPIFLLDFTPILAFKNLGHH